MLCMRSILAKQNKYKIIVPRLRYLRLPKKNDLGPSKLLRYLETLLSWSYDDPRRSRLHTKIGLLTKSMVSQQCQRNKNAQEIHLSR